MKKLQERSAEECFARHQQTPIRVYSETKDHELRIERSRRAVVAALKDMGQQTPHVWRKIVEVGCGMADISGWFSQGHHVIGMEGSAMVALECQKRWPWMRVVVADIQKADAIECDLVVLCEILEHTADPKGIVAGWLKKARYSVITSPLDGDSTRDLSNGEHRWSFNGGDFHEFFLLGEHAIQHKELIAAGEYQIFLGIGKRMEKP